MAHGDSLVRALGLLIEEINAERPTYQGMPGRSPTGSAEHLLLPLSPEVWAPPLTLIFG
ncbi:MAG: hypothetical protein ACYDH5_16430 [Acidimicrobiales bacterium]